MMKKPRIIFDTNMHWTEICTKLRKDEKAGRITTTAITEGQGFVSEPEYLPSYFIIQDTKL